MTRKSTAHRRRRWRLPTPAAIALLAVVFATALLAPLPVAPNQARAEVMANVERRLPGWHIERARSSWEGAWSVVATCGTLHLGFQLVPGHGLAPGDAWLHPGGPVRPRAAGQHLGQLARADLVRRADR